MTISFQIAYEKWIQLRQRKSKILPDKLYEEIETVLHNGLMENINYSTWKNQYIIHVRNGEIGLFVIRNVFHTKKPSGRHAKRIKITDSNNNDNNAEVNNENNNCERAIPSIELPTMLQIVSFSE